MVPSVRNKIAMLESRSAALREFTSGAAAAVGSGGSSPATSPMKATRLTTTAGEASRGLGRKGSWMSNAESEDGGSVVSSVVSVPEYMKSAASGGAGGFNAPVLRSLR